jgi:hypothetical protein
MKKALCAVAVFFGVLFTVAAQWETEPVDSGRAITGYTGNGTASTIPARIDGEPVVGIGGYGNIGPEEICGVFEGKAISG